MRMYYFDLQHDNLIGRPHSDPVPGQDGRFQMTPSFRLLFQALGRSLGTMAKGHHHSCATARRFTAESSPRRQGLITVRQKQIRKVPPTVPNICSHD